MANILDYLDWRGDLTFEQDPFHEVDNLILSQLAYVDFQGIVGEEEIALQEASEQFFLTHDEKEILSRVSMTKQAILVLKKMSETKRFQNVGLFGYQNIIRKEEQTQFAALCIRLSDDSIYVAFSGTDATLIGWREDFNLAYLTETKGHRLASAYVDRLCDMSCSGLRLGGHSKGGNFAAYAAMDCSPAVQERILQVYSNDGPGFDKSVVKSSRYQKMVSRLISIMPESSLVGMLLEHQEDYVLVQSTNVGMNQHDAMSWEVLGNHFVRAEQMDEKTVLLNETLEQWLTHFNPTERQQMIDALFSLLDAAGIKTVDDFFELRFSGLQEAVRASQEISEDTRRLLREAIRLLLQSGKEAMLTLWKDKEK